MLPARTIRLVSTRLQGASQQSILRQSQLPANLGRPGVWSLTPIVEQGLAENWPTLSD